MGAIILARAIQGCCLVENNEENYTKLEEKKDGLDVYKPKVTLSENSYIWCPICGSSHKSNTNIKEALRKGVEAICNLDLRYHNLVLTWDEVDIFEKLESIKKEREEIIEHYEERIYQKYTCEYKNIQCYIKIYNYTKEEFAQKTFWGYEDKRYDYSNWKNDDNLKKTLLAERQEHYKKYLEYQKKQKEEERIKNLKEQIREEWDEITFQKEISSYNSAINFVQQQYNFYRDTWTDFGSYNDLCLLYNPVQSYCQYNAGKWKLIQSISKFAKSSYDRSQFLRRPEMSEKEKAEYQKFYNSRFK